MNTHTQINKQTQREGERLTNKSKIFQLIMNGTTCNTLRVPPVESYILEYLHFENRAGMPNGSEIVPHAQEILSIFPVVLIEL